MATEIRYRWRIRWGAQWITTRRHATEEQTRIKHPEATLIEGTRQEVETCEDWREFDEALLSWSR